jgi:hypothetical protein
VPEFQHFLLTKFNVVRRANRVDEGGTHIDKTGAPVRTLDWLEHRFELFERFCLPSVSAQTNLSFTWLIRFDDQVPEPYVRRMRAHVQAFPNLLLVPARRGFHNVIPELLGSRTEWLLTTRFDSDDALHRDAIDVVQQSCRDLRELVFINMQYGYAYAHPEGYAVRIRDRSNNTISLLERRTDALPHTAICVGHADAGSFAPVHQVGDKPLWLQVIHDRNVHNTMPADCEPEPIDRSAFGLAPG